MEYTDLRVKLFRHLASHPKSIHKLVNNYFDFKKLIQMDRDYLQTPECNNVTAQGLLFQMLAKDSELLNKVVKDHTSLGSIAYLIKSAPISEEKKVELQVQVVETLMAIENKLLDIYHPKIGEKTRDCYSNLISHDCHEWPPAFITHLSKMEVEQLFPIIFEEFKANNFSNYDNFIGTLEDMRIRWKTFDKATYEFCVNQVMAILNLPTMTTPLYRCYLVGILEDCEKSRPKGMDSLLPAELQHKIKTDPGFELYRNTDASLLTTSQQKSGLLKSVASPESSSASICREPSPKPTGLPVTVKSN